MKRIKEAPGRKLEPRIPTEARTRSLGYDMRLKVWERDHRNYLAKTHRNRAPKASDELIALYKMFRNLENPDLWSDTPLGSEDREILRKVLWAIFTDVDVRDWFFESVKHRKADLDRPFHLALAVTIALKRGQKEKAAKLDVCQRWGCTPDQLKHALATYREQCQEIIQKLNNDELDKVNAWHLSRMKGQKKPKSEAGESQRSEAQAQRSATQARDG